jgi:hypothetical protein
MGFSFSKLHPLKESDGKRVPFLLPLRTDKRGPGTSGCNKTFLQFRTLIRYIILLLFSAGRRKKSNFISHSSSNVFSKFFFFFSTIKSPKSRLRL